MQLEHQDNAGLIPVFAGAALSAALLGVSDAAIALGSGTLLPSFGRQLILTLVSGGLLTIIGSASAVVLVFFGKWFPFLRAKWAGFLWGLAVVLLLGIAEWWFTPPPAFAGASGLRGNPIAFLGIGAVVLAVWGALSRHVPEGRSRRFIGIGVSFLLTSQVLSSRRLLPGRGMATPGSPNVVVVTFDTIREDYFGAYGNPTVKTPHFDSLATDGVLFSSAWSQIPVTGPSHTTIFTGQAPWEHGNLLNGIPIDDEIPLMAEYLREDFGYSTGAFVSAYVLDGDLGFSRGFEVYDDDFGWLQGWADTLPGKLIAGAGRHFNPEHVLERRGERTVDHALGWIGNQDERRPFFVWVHLFDPHGPYEPPPPWDTAYYSGDPRDPSHTSMEEVSGVAGYLTESLDGITDVDWVLAQYAGEVSYADAQLGALLDGIDAIGQTDNTLVVMAGDHGESLGEHNVWFNHGDDLYLPSTAVPLAIRFPGKITPGSVVDQPVELTDVAPTIYELIGVASPEGVKGRSLSPAISGNGIVRDYVRGLCFDREANLKARSRGEITQPVYRMVSLRRNNSLFVHREAAGTGDVYYDLTEDPTEMTPAPLSPELASALTGLATQLLDEMSDEDVARSGSELDEATRERLEALGYIE